MNKKEVDALVGRLLEETKKSQVCFNKEDITKCFAKQYSHDQIERIYHRYRYLYELKKDV